jgi:hypothetical protein
MVIEVSFTGDELVYLRAHLSRIRKLEGPGYSDLGEKVKLAAAVVKQWQTALNAEKNCAQAIMDCARDA